MPAQEHCSAVRVFAGPDQPQTQNSLNMHPYIHPPDSSCCGSTILTAAVVGPQQLAVRPQRTPRHGQQVWQQPALLCSCFHVPSWLRTIHLQAIVGRLRAPRPHRGRRLQACATKEPEGRRTRQTAQAGRRDNQHSRKDVSTVAESAPGTALRLQGPAPLGTPTDRCGARTHTTSMCSCNNILQHMQVPRIAQRHPTIHPT